MLKQYIGNIKEALSQVLAALVGLDSNLTFSAYCGKWKEEGLPVRGKIFIAVNFLFMDSEHCQDAWEQKI